MLELGVFEGKYLNSTQYEYPKSWFKHAKLSDIPDPTINFFGVKSRQPLSVWLDNNWIHPLDPWGWFQWYCRYYSGRRCADDERQIGRWKAMQRHAAQLRRHCRKGDHNCRRVQRQALLHWAYDSRNI